MERYAVITVLDNLSETSMPWNEFVLYRHNQDKDLKQYVIVCDSAKIINSIPEDLDITFTGFNSKAIRQTMKRILSECKASQLDFIVHLHQSKSAAYFNLATFFSGYAKKTLFTVHSQFPAYNLQNKIASLFNALHAKRINNVSATSYTAYPGLVKKLKGSRITYIENGVDIDRIDHIISNHKIKKCRRKRFVYVARMIPLKRHEFMIDVFHDINLDYELVLIGAEDPNGKIRNLIQAYGMSDKVVLTGLIPREELFTLLADSDVYVSTSSIEGLPVSVLEAMAVRLPAVVSDIDPHKEILRACDAIDILPFDKAMWVQKIKEIIQTSDDVLEERGAKCRDAVVATFSLKAMHQRYYAEYEKLLR
ncbi:glycosyltransferase family 4 protein [Holdemania massiliensis]|uniref:glycosyltransferase family 4 protein n=1 Tax=Holdemania massiliensis TaxID=1468449 RepID=UPI001F06A28B|nr:glycosyltransferase family 4 protein [Holdemania massiliensis]MCH1940700.1 glycosyltransferase family 4 protein [Holdemania massiliensis]